MRRAPISLLLILPLIGCSRGAPPAAPIGIAEPAPAPLAVVMPRPPANAAPNLTLPIQLEDGSYATPNRGLSDAAAIWHVRSALNVAVLTCGTDPALAASYNDMLSTHRVALAKAHKALAADQGGGMDVAMTRLYNYFAQPPVQRDFCPVAIRLLGEAAIVRPPQLASFAQDALAQLDAPFVAFYRAYDTYRADLALWRAGQLAAPAPRLAYDSQQFMRDDAVIGGQPAKIVASR